MDNDIYYFYNKDKNIQSKINIIDFHTNDTNMIITLFNYIMIEEQWNEDDDIIAIPFTNNNGSYEISYKNIKFVEQVFI